MTSRRARPARLRTAAVRAFARALARAAAVVAIVAVLAAAAPVTIAGLAGAALAWLRGWPPARLYRAAGWCGPMVAVWLAAVAVRGRGLAPVAAAPYNAWLGMWRDGAAGSYLRAAVVIAPAAVPLGLIAAGLAWSVRLRSMASLAGGASPAGAIAFDRRQWRHQVRAARARSAAPGSVPLLTGHGDFAAGTVIRSVGHRPGMLTRLPPDRLRSHQIVVGGTGTGKTTLLLRLWAAYMAAGLSRHAAGRAGPPLIVVLDCKGGADARRIAERARRVLREAGARNVAVWPDEATLNLWALPPRQLITTLVDLIEHGSGGAAYYTDVMDAVVALAVEAPCGPPLSSPDFLARLEPGWLTLAYSAGGLDDQLQTVRAAAGQLADIALRYRTLFRRLGGGLDGPGNFADADAWYCILEGTAELRVAEAQARALVDMLASYVSRDPAGPAAGPARLQVLLAVDEFSAVSRRLPIWQLYERARALGLAVQVSAQSWHGLAPAEADRYRIAATAEGGIWLLRTAHPEPLAELAGQHKAVSTTRQLLGFLRWGGQGSSRVQDTPVVDSWLIRGLDVGQAAYLYRGGVTYTQVKRLVAGPAALTAVSADRAVTSPPGTDIRDAGATGQRRPDIAPFLDAAFGPAQGLRSQCLVRARFRTAAGRPAMTRASASDTFAVLGLGRSPDLVDDEVRAAWRRVAAATHPDRADGGDPQAFAAAAAAYTALRTMTGRREALADAAGPGAIGPARDRRRPGLRLIPARVRGGRPAVLASRIAAVAGLGTVAVTVAGWQPATPAIITGGLTWLILTARGDLAPPP